MGLLLLLSGCANAPAASITAETPRVRVATVEQAPARDRVVLHGVTQATEQVTTAFAVGGTVSSAAVRVGDPVERGATLATLDATPFARQVDALNQSLYAARAAAAQAERDLTRLEALAASQTITAQQTEQLRSQRDQANASVDGLQAQLAAARWNRSQATLRSPQAGVVVRRMVDVGAVVAPGTPVFEVRASSGVEIELGLSESHLGKVWTGQTVSVQFPLSDVAEQQGTVAAVSEAATARGLFPVRVLLDDPSLRPGLATTVRVSAPVEDVLSVPLSAVVSPGGKKVWVHRVQGGTVDRVPVQTGPIRQDRLQISGALQPGEEVVVSGHAGLSAGAAVEVVR